MTHVPWTDDRVERMTKMWDEGQSASEIAAVLGHTTRNAVIGKISRLGLQRNEGAVHEARKAMRPKVTRQPARKGAEQLRLARQRSANAGARPERQSRKDNKNHPSPSRLRPQGPPAPAVIFDATVAKPWLARAFGECAYPISGEGAETFSCCLPTAATYCPAHAAVMFQPATPQQQRKRDRLQRLAA